MFDRVKRQYVFMIMKDSTMMEHFSVKGRLFRNESKKVSKMCVCDILKVTKSNTIMGAILKRGRSICFLAYYFSIYIIVLNYHQISFILFNSIKIVVIKFKKFNLWSEFYVMLELIKIRWKIIGLRNLLKKKKISYYFWLN